MLRGGGAEISKRVRDEKVVKGLPAPRLKRDLWLRGRGPRGGMWVLCNIRIMARPNILCRTLEIDLTNEAEEGFQGKLPFAT